MHADDEADGRQPDARKHQKDLERPQLQVEAAHIGQWDYRVLKP